MHPDPYYTYRASTSRSCHGKKAKKKSKQAKYWGTPAGYVKKPYSCPTSLMGNPLMFSDCDSPLVLTNFTLDYLETNWADQVDFVICES